MVHQSTKTLGISKSAVSRQRGMDSATAMAQLMDRNFKDVDIVAVFMDGIIARGHHVLAALGVDASGHKHLLGLAGGAKRERQGSQRPPHPAGRSRAWT